MFRKVLIANRGEIALRILRACRALGVEAVVAYSEADRESLPVGLADEAICIGPPDAQRSYLSAPAVISAALVTGCDALLRAIRISDGQEQYHVSSGAYTGASPAVVGRRAYYGTFEHEVLGVDLAAKTVLWRYKPVERQFPFYSSAAVDAGKVVLGGRDKLVHCLDAETGKAAWTFATKGRVDSSPVIAGGRVYVGSADGRVYALDLASGKAADEFDAGSPITASPALAGGRLVIGTQDGQVFCLGAKG